MPDYVCKPSPKHTWMCRSAICFQSISWKYHKNTTIIPQTTRTNIQKHTWKMLVHSRYLTNISWYFQKVSNIWSTSLYVPWEIFCSATTVGLIGYSEACGSDHSMYVVAYDLYKVNKRTSWFFLFLFVLWYELTLLDKIPVRCVFFFALWGEKGKIIHC